ncbi:cation transporter [Paenibacillus thailandensis]|uniref:Cation transporter n=1 Tax=Paenibacillus thailandensis TaxID=393250 RepID=A0ABW5QXU0_9BACL
MKTVTLEVNGMSCQHCVNSIEGALKQIGAEGKVHLSGGTVDVRYDEGKVTLQTIKETIEEQGYDVV